MVFRSEEEEEEEKGVLMMILKVCVGLRISADLRYPKKHPTISSVFRCRPHVVECLPKNLKAAPAPGGFLKFWPKWKIVPDTRDGEKVGRERREG